MASISSALGSSFDCFLLRRVLEYTMASLRRRFIAMLTAVDAINRPSRDSFVGSPMGSHNESTNTACMASVEGKG
jgi:hypothetical protein